MITTTCRILWMPTYGTPNDGGSGRGMGVVRGFDDPPQPAISRAATMSVGIFRRDVNARSARAGRRRRSGVRERTGRFRRPTAITTLAARACCRFVRRSATYEGAAITRLSRAAMAAAAFVALFAFNAGL